MNLKPIQFEQDGNEYKASMSQVPGAGNEGIWYLRDNKGHYLGKLRTHHGKWFFDDANPKNKLSELAEWFGHYREK
jgi:hypothetical protein